MAPSALKEELAAWPGALALASADTRSGRLLELHVRGEVTSDDVEAAALAAEQLCSTPGGALGDPDEATDEALVVGARWVHAYARSPHLRHVVLVAVGAGDVNVALLRAWLREVAERSRARA